MSVLTDIINNTENLYLGNLKHYFRKIFESRGANNPYHNIRHASTILIRGYEAIKFYTPRDLSYGTLVLNRNLLIACLLHDIEHPGRAGNDDLNIQLAIRAWRKICLPEDKENSDDIENLISITEYGPKGHVHSPISERHRIIRDADLSQIVSDAWIRMIVFGLAEEMNVTPLEMLKMQNSFLKGVSFESRWGQQFKPKLQEKVQEAEELIKILQ